MFVRLKFSPPSAENSVHRDESKSTGEITFFVYRFLLSLSLSLLSFFFFVLPSARNEGISSVLLRVEEARYCALSFRLFTVHRLPNYDQLVPPLSSIVLLERTLSCRFVWPAIQDTQYFSITRFVSRNDPNWSDLLLVFSVMEYYSLSTSFALFQRTTSKYRSGK